MDLTTPPQWTGGDLRRFGVALVSGEPPPSSGPSYDDIVLWYTELCAEVSAHIVVEEWATCTIDPLDVSSRPKTLATITDKLSRMSTSLDRVQDLAGIRIDSDFLLSEQDAFAKELADYFGRLGADKVKVKDIRDSPHSGYRAIHIHVTLPAGRCEIQVRTRAQSAWANAYEALADVYGRGLRYGQEHHDPAVQEIVDTFQRLSGWIARNEKRLVDCAGIRSSIDDLDERGGFSSVEVEDLVARVDSVEARLRRQTAEYLSRLNHAEGTLRAMSTGEGR